jgi:hypothetical protein
MKKINSKREYDKKNLNLTSYSFEINNEHFLVNYNYGKKPRFELYHNDLLIRASDLSNSRNNYSVNSESGIINITIWIEYSDSYTEQYKTNGIGIEVNGNPVQNTLADPDLHIMEGLVGFWCLLFLLLIKSIITYITAYFEYNSHFTSIFSSLIYFIPLLIVLFLIIIYKKWTKFALIICFIIAILDFIDYSVSLFIKLASGIDGKFLDSFKMVIIQIIIWLPIRIGILYLLYNAIKWRKKIEKKENQNELNNRQFVI